MVGGQFYAVVIGRDSTATAPPAAGAVSAFRRQGRVAAAELAAEMAGNSAFQGVADRMIPLKKSIQHTDIDAQNAGRLGYGNGRRGRLLHHHLDGSAAGTPAAHTAVDPVSALALRGLGRRTVATTPTATIAAVAASLGLAIALDLDGSRRAGRLADSVAHREGDLVRPR